MFFKKCVLFFITIICLSFHLYAYATIWDKVQRQIKLTHLVLRKIKSKTRNKPSIFEKLFPISWKTSDPQDDSIKAMPLDPEIKPIIEQFFAKQSDKKRARPKVRHRINKKNLYEQDRFCGFLMQKLMDTDDETSYQLIARCLEECPLVVKKFPQFTRLIETHQKKPQPTRFVAAFSALPHEELPPSVRTEVIVFQDKLSRMGLFKKLSVRNKILRKFKS